MNLYKYFTRPEQLVGYENRFRVPSLAYELAEDGEITWKQAEPYIMKDPWLAYEYARDVLERRWPKAEPYIMKDPESACMYAHHILKHRWPEAEPYIMKDPESAYWYAVRVLKRRWPEAEPNIMKDPNSWNAYRKFFEL